MASWEVMPSLIFFRRYALFSDADISLRLGFARTLLNILAASSFARSSTTCSSRRSISRF
jgi:hypothetical protein